MLFTFNLENFWKIFPFVKPCQFFLENLFHTSACLPFWQLPIWHCHFDPPCQTGSCHFGSAISAAAILAAAILAACHYDSEAGEDYCRAILCYLLITLRQYYGIY